MTPYFLSRKFPYVIDEIPNSIGKTVTRAANQMGLKKADVFESAKKSTAYTNEQTISRIPPGRGRKIEKIAARTIRHELPVRSAFCAGRSSTGPIS